jgi:hypothetical protein
VEALQPLLADELVKAMVPNAGTGAEREHQVAQIASNLAPGQWEGKKATYTQAVGTQLQDLERQFRSSLHFMPKDLVDEEWKAKLAPELQKAIDVRDQSTGATQFKSLVDLQAAVKAGQVPRPQAELIARQQGWIR